MLNKHESSIFCGTKYIVPKKVVISFVDQQYHIVRKNTNSQMLGATQKEHDRTIAPALAPIAKERGLAIETCAELTDLQEFGIGKAKCIDSGIFEWMTEKRLSLGKDPWQREECGCHNSQDIGAYGTCTNGCKYCYANTDHAAAETAKANHDPNRSWL